MRAITKTAALLVCLAIALSLHASSPFEAPATEHFAQGRLLVLPGIRNTKFHLSGFMNSAQRQLPNFDISVETWGLPLMGMLNLRAEQRNLESAQRIAAEITLWRRSHPEQLFYLMGYSGGGGIAALTLQFLPDDIAIDRLILIAPAISPEFPLARHAADHVNEFVANYASQRDIQVGWGTRTFGTIDRRYGISAGYSGFSQRFDQLAQWNWSTEDRSIGHRGNHVAYLSRRWQRVDLLPALDPGRSHAELVSYWALRR